MTWREIPGYNGDYEVSDLGHVKSNARIIHHARYGEYPLRERILRPLVNSDGYLHVGLHKDKKKTSVAIHTLVARCFISSDADGLEVNHINGDKTDNRAINLEWVTHRRNMEHSFEIGLNKNKKQPVLASNGVTYESITAAGKALNIDAGHLYQALTGKLKHAKGYTFRRVSV